MSMEKKASEVLEQAKAAAARVKSWADFSNELYAPGGIVATAFPDEIERQAFYNSDQCEKVDDILASLMSKFGILHGAAVHSGKTVVPVPNTVPEKPDIEAPGLAHS